MSAYFIAHLDVLDRKAFREYERGVLQSLKPFQGRVLAAAPGQAAEGAAPRNHNVIIEFPDLEKARAWWDSADYRAIVPIRHEHAPGTDALFVPGLEPR